MKIENAGAGRSSSEVPSSDPASVRASAVLPRDPYRRLRRTLLVASIGVVVAWTGLAFSFGVGVGTRAVPEPPTPPPDVVIEVNELAIPERAADDDPASIDQAVVANVLGLELETARNVLADNASGVLVEVVDEPAAGEAGVVVSQEPPPGTIDPERVVLTVTAEAPMPDLVGTTQVAAVEALEAIGSRVRIVEQYVPGVEAGVVLAVDPAEGVVPFEVEMTVGAPASSAFLITLGSIRSDCRRSDVNVDGGRFTDAIDCAVPRLDREPNTTEYDLSRDTNQLSFGVGVTDTSDLGTRARVTVELDGALAFDQIVEFGQLVETTVDTTGVLRLAISVFGVDDESSSGRVAFVDARVLGGADAIDALAAGS